jgi:hypothetical protein
MLTRLLALAAGVAALNGGPAFAQAPGGDMSWPTLAACQSPSHPMLPAKWRGTFLMQPFKKPQPQITMSEIVSDSAVPATLIGLYGAQRGSRTFLVAGETTYLLTLTGGAPTECQSLGDTGWRPMKQDWLDSKAVCAGSLPVAETAVDWWKTPAPTTRATPAIPTNWIWYKHSDRSPFRIMFDQADASLAPLSEFAFSYQVKLEPVAQTNLSELAAFCRAAKPHPGGSGRTALLALIDAMAQSSARASADIERLMPELDASCSGASLPKWPETLGMTSIMTPVRFDYSPFSTQVYYRWATQSQRATMLSSVSPRRLGEDALLLGQQGYDMLPNPTDPNAPPSCSADLPGPPRPNWPTVSPCTCAGVIKGKTPLSPYGTTQIMTCPMTDRSMFWTWYTLESRPVVFMETSSPADEGTGLALADYYQWSPGHSIPGGIFDKPPQCPAGPAPAAAARSSSPRMMGHRADVRAAVTSGGLPPQCFTCHLGSAGAR